MLTLDVKNDIRLTDGTFRIVGRLGNDYKLKNQSTGERSVATLADIYSRLIEIPDEPDTPSPQELSQLTPAEQAEVDLWVSHIEEINTGLIPGQTTPRPGYDPETTTQNDRIDAKVSELQRFGYPSSRASIFRKKKLYKQGGPAALIDRRKGRQVPFFAQADERVVAAMSRVITRQGNKSTGTQKRLHALVKAEVLLSNPAEPVHLPSASTFYRHFKALDPAKYATGKATSRRSKANVPNRPFGAVQRLLPGEEAQMDSTELDLYVRTKNGWARPTLTILQDRGTRSIIGYNIRLVAAKGYDHALLLAGTLIPFSERPDNTDQRKLLALRYPDLPLLSPEEQSFHQRSRPFIYPRRIVIDNGQDFKSKVFLSACQKYGIDVTFSAPRTPTDKPHVERNFKSIADLFTEDLPGHVGNSTVNRGRDVEKQDLVDVPMLNELFGDWVANVWQNREHGGLLDLYDPSQKFSPNQWYNATADLAGEAAFPRTTDTYIELMPTEYRVITPTGVRWGNRHYDSPELHPHRGMPSNLPGKGNQWEVKYNPYDVTRVWVRSPENTWLECRWKLAPTLDRPHVGDIMQGLRDKTAERNDVARSMAARAGTPMPEGIPDEELLALFATDDTTEFEVYGDEDDSADDFDIDDYLATLTNTER